MATTDSSIDCRRHSPCDLLVGLPVQGTGTQLVSLLKDVLRAADGGVWRIADMARHLFHSVFLLSSPWHHVVVSVVRTHDMAL